MSLNTHIANNIKVIQGLEKREGKSFSEIVELQNAKMDAKVREKLSVKPRTDTSQPPAFHCRLPSRPNIIRTITKRNAGTCVCGSSYKRILINNNFIVLCRRTNRSPRNCVA